MDECVVLYLKDRLAKLQRKQLRQAAIDLRVSQNEARPLIQENLRRERERRSKGDGFIIIPKY